MGYFRVCNYCGAHLDPGEKCECYIKPHINLMDKYISLLIEGKNGQLKINLKEIAA